MVEFTKLFLEKQTIGRVKKNVILGRKTGENQNWMAGKLATANIEWLENWRQSK